MDQGADPWIRAASLLVPPPRGLVVSIASHHPHQLTNLSDSSCPAPAAPLRDPSLGASLAEARTMPGAGSAAGTGNVVLQLAENAGALLDVLICSDHPVGLQRVELGQAFPEAEPFVVRQSLNSCAGEAICERVDA